MLRAFLTVTYAHDRGESSELVRLVDVREERQILSIAQGISSFFHEVVAMSLVCTWGTGKTQWVWTRGPA